MTALDTFEDDHQAHDQYVDCATSLALSLGPAWKLHNQKVNKSYERTCEFCEAASKQYDLLSHLGVRPLKFSYVS